MPGRTENNVKNRFNMMYKTMKDSSISNITHESVFVMQEKLTKDKSTNQIDEYINELTLIEKLIDKKK